MSSVSGINWTVAGPTGKVKRVVEKKHPHLAEIEIKEGIAKGQKVFAENYNSMRKMLLDNGLMEDRGA